MPKLEPMQQPPSRMGGRRARVMKVSTSLAEINVVPMIDVMLVLLVIFMVAAPMMQQGFPIQLPQSRTAKAINEPVTITVPLSFRKDKRVRLGDEAVGIDVLAERVRQALSGQLQQTVVLAADGAAMWQEVITVFDTLVAGGVDRVSVQTQPVIAKTP
jgi:biopolymer transport protein TolR